MEILRSDDQDETPTSAPEVEFALVLSRMIESVQNDPEHLRATIYELARHKMEEQSRSQGPAERRELLKALETAIHGVETFVKKNDIGGLPRPGAPRVPVLGAPNVAVIGPGSPESEVRKPRRATKQRAFRFTTAWRFASVLAIAMALVLVVTRREWIRGHEARVATLFAPTMQIPLPTGAPATNAPPTAEPSPTTPATYGIYAVSDDKLYELEALPGRAPDIRIAVSAAIQTPSRTILPDGHLKFIVYRRDSASSAADHAEIRIIAKIRRETGFDPTGKAAVKKIDDTWVIRNISIPFRTAPKNDSPDMYEVLSEDPQSVLTPGRYALVLRGQAYDFSVAGPVSDPRQCLERLSATNGLFYSACQKP